MLWRVVGIAIGLAVLAVLIGGWPRLWRPSPLPTVLEMIEQGALKDPAIPAVEEGWRQGLSPLITGKWHRIPVADLERTLQEVDSRSHAGLHQWFAVIRRYAAGQPVLIGGSFAVVPTSGGVLWIGAPTFTSQWADNKPELRGYVADPGTDRIDCRCRETAYVCVLKHEDVLRCVRKVRPEDKLPFGGESYAVYIDKPIPGWGQRAVFPNIMTPVKAIAGAKGR